MENESDDQSARRLTRMMGLVIAVMAVLIASALYWGACGEERSVADRGEVPHRDATRPAGAPGVAQPILE